MRYNLLLVGEGDAPSMRVELYTFFLYIAICKAGYFMEVLMRNVGIPYCRDGHNGHHLKALTLPNHNFSVTK